MNIGRRPIVAALLGVWDELMKVLSVKETGGGGPDASDEQVEQRPFDTPYREYVKRINAERAAEWQHRNDSPVPEPIASPESLDYDSRVGQGAPAAGAKPVLDTVAPTLIQDAERSIALTKQALGTITRTAAITARRRLDDEAAMLALCALLLDED